MELTEEEDISAERTKTTTEVTKEDIRTERTTTVEVTKEALPKAKTKVGISASQVGYFVTVVNSIHF